MKLLLPLICTLCCLSLSGQAQTPPATGSLSDAAKGAVQEAITAAKKELSEKNVALTAALKAKTDAVSVRDAGAEKIKKLEETATKSTDAAAKKAAQDELPAAALSQLAFLKVVEEKTQAADAAQNAQIAVENKLNSLQGTGSAAPNPITLGNDRIYQASLAALTKIFVVAVLLESGLALLFTWSVFLTYLNRRAWRPVIMFIAALILILGFDLDIVAQLIAIYNGAPAVTGFASWMSVFISATVLAGGSAGVFNIMATLGFRSKQERDSTPPPPGAEQAWVSVRLPGFKGGAHHIKVNIEEITDATKVPTPPPAATAGTISGKTPEVLDLFLSIKDRFPPTAGYTVKAGMYYKIQVMDGDKDLLEDNGFYKFAPRAIVDLVVPYAEAITEPSQTAPNVPAVIAPTKEDQQALQETPAS